MTNRGSRNKADGRGRWGSSEEHEGHNPPTGAANTITTGSVWGQAAWLPVSGFLIGAEVGYVAARGGTSANSIATGGAPGTVSRSQNQWVGRVRFQRDF